MEPHFRVQQVLCWGYKYNIKSGRDGISTDGIYLCVSPHHPMFFFPLSEKQNQLIYAVFSLRYPPDNKGIPMTSTGAKRDLFFMHVNILSRSHPGFQIV